MITVSRDNCVVTSVDPFYAWCLSLHESNLSKLCPNHPTDPTFQNLLLPHLSNISSWPWPWPGYILTLIFSRMIGGISDWLLTMSLTLHMTMTLTLNWTLPLRLILTLILNLTMTLSYAIRYFSKQLNIHFQNLWQQQILSCWPWPDHEFDQNLDYGLPLGLVLDSGNQSHIKPTGPYYFGICGSNNIQILIVSFSDHI